MREPFAASHQSTDAVLDEATGQRLDARTLIGDDLERVVQLVARARQALVRGCDRLLCAECKSPVYPVAHIDQRGWHFRHVPGEPARLCPVASSNDSVYTRDQLAAMQFMGRSEGRKHKALKSWIAHSLLADERFTEVRVEGRWTGEDGAYRRPDVSAVWRGGFRLAFEVQLSTTASQIMAERREFYRREGGVVVWVVDEYNDQHDTLTKHQAFYPNNCNVLLATAESLEASIAANAFTLECRWHEVTRAGKRLRRALVRFDELTIDQPGQRVFYYDVEGAEASANRQAEAESAALRQKIVEALEGHFTESVPLTWDRWEQLSAELAQHTGIALPRFCASSFMVPARSALAAMRKVPVGTRHQKLVEVAHHVFEQHKPHLWWFLMAVTRYGAKSAIVADDASGSWHRKRDKAIKLFVAGAPEVTPEREHEKVLALLFPEVAEVFAMDPATWIMRNRKTRAAEMEAAAKV